MSDHKKRIKTIQAIIAKSVISGDREYNNILGEFGSVNKAGKIKDKNRKQLLQILHCTRGLDTSLKIVCSQRHYRVQAPSLGGYLIALTNRETARNPGKLSEHERREYQVKIVDERNKFMHKAGAFPANDGEVKKILSKMEECLTRILVSK